MKNVNKKAFISICVATVIYIIYSIDMLNKSKSLKNHPMFQQTLKSFSQNTKKNFTLKNVQNLTKPKKGVDKWIVVTSINLPSDQIKKLANISTFQLLVVGDSKTSSDWYNENTIFLSVDNQKELSLKSLASVPFNSYTRKNVGYLYAIKMGAKYIYDTDDDNAPIVDLETYFSYGTKEYGLQFDCQSPAIVNPYAHFGQPTIWPRGYPLTEISKSHYNNYLSGPLKSSLIQQGVVNGDPDVDAIFRLTKSMQHKKINLTFDERAPSLQIPLFRFSPFNSQNTLFHYEAFWALYLPKTVSFRLTDIWRSYWAQRLLWLLNGTVGFRGPSAFQFRNSHSYLKDFYEEEKMYAKTNELVEFLNDWKCSKVDFLKFLLSFL
jgi:hypothetical protein